MSAKDWDNMIHQHKQSEVGGFWVPRSVIVREGPEAVHVKEWFRINIVQMR